MKGDFDFKKFIAAVVVAGMLICEVFLGIRVVRNIESANKMTEETEEEAVLKAEYKDKAHNQLCLAVLYGVLFSGMGLCLAEWADT